MSIKVLIPAYQPDQKLIDLVNRLSLQYPVIVVDDGSGEANQQVFATLMITGATILHHACNRGKGAALKTGIHYISEQCGADGIITALGGYMLGWWRGYRRKSDAMQTGVRVLLLCKLEQMQREMVANDGIADNTAKRTAQLVYDSYHSLGEES